MKTSINTIKLAGLLALLIFTFNNCRKDDCNKPIRKCENFPERDGGGITGAVMQKSNQRQAPCFNPNNSSEFVYLKIQDNIQSLVKSNLETGVDEILLENTKIVTQPYWGTNNLIVFFQIDLRVYTLNLENHRLKVVTNIFESIHPKVYQDSFILFIVGAETVEGASGLKKIKSDGIRTDSIQIGDLEGFNSTVGLFSPSSQHIYAEFGNIESYGIYSIQFESREVRALVTGTFENFNKVEGISNFKDEMVVYSTFRTGVFTFDISKEKQKCIKKACDSRTYKHLSISPNGKKILTERVDATDYNTEDGGWTEESKIVIMNIDGKDEKVLFE